MGQSKSHLDSISKVLISSLLLSIMILCYEVRLRPLLKSATSVEIVIKPGETITSLAYRLKHVKTIRSSLLFRIAFLLQFPAKSMKSGHYSIAPGESMQDLIVRIAKGEVLQEAFTIIEGSTWKQIWEKLHVDARLQHSTEDEIVTFFETMNQLPTGSGVEGLFLPNTYHFASGVRDLEVLMHAYSEQEAFLQDVWPEKNSHVQIKRPYEALIIASMIEKESRLASEYPIISSVIHNRLRRGMPLQIDAAVLYGKEQPGLLTRRDLRRQTPYNTYKIRGLPPTPISMARKEAILAALKPEETTYLYYVVKKDGSHYFSKTYKEHLQAINAYLKEKKI